MTDKYDDFSQLPQDIIDEIKRSDVVINFTSDENHLLAADERDILKACKTFGEVMRFYKAFDKRRAQLSELDKKRMESMAWNPKGIQEIFDRLQIPLEL